MVERGEATEAGDMNRMALRTASASASAAVSAGGKASIVAASGNEKATWSGATKNARDNEGHARQKEVLLSLLNLLVGMK